MSDKAAVLKQRDRVIDELGGIAMQRQELKEQERALNVRQKDLHVLLDTLNRELSR